MSKQFLIFTDLDGTLLDHYNYKTDQANETIAELKLRKIAIIPNSSKTFSEIMVIRQQLNLNSPFIIENGAAVYIPTNYFDQQPPETKLEGDFWVKSFCQSKEHWLGLLEDQAKQFKDNYQGFSQLTIQQLADLTGLSVDTKPERYDTNYSEGSRHLPNFVLLAFSFTKSCSTQENS